MATGQWQMITKQQGHPLPSASYKPDSYPLALVLVSSVQCWLVKAGAREVLATGNFFFKCLRTFIIIY